MIDVIILGNGRFGKYIARILSSFEISSLNIDITPDGENNPWPTEEAWQEVKVVVFAVPMENLEDTVIEHAQYLRPGTLVVDVCSLKVFACEVLRKYLPADVEAIGTHPLFGPQSAQDKIGGQMIAVCNVSAKEQTYMKFLSWLNQANLKIMPCTPEFHDKEMAKSQALTHFIGRALQKMELNDVMLSTKSFRDLMGIVEVVKGNSETLFTNMEQMNPYTKDVNKRFLQSVEEIYAELFT